MAKNELKNEEEEECIVRNSATADSRPQEPIHTPKAFSKKNKHILLTYPCKGRPGEWNLTEGVVQELEELYPHIDIRLECRKARMWCNDNPTKRKYAKSMKRFLNGWIERANSSGRVQYKDQQQGSGDMLYSGHRDYEPSDWTPEEMELLHGKQE